MRYERARWRYRGVEVDETDSTEAPAIRSIVGPESSREDFMPAVSLAGRFGDQLEVRAAWSRTVARPRFYDLVPYRLVDREDEELTLGNPHLRPARSWNQDVEIVYCAGCLAQLGVNLFARQIDDFFFVRRRAAAFEGRIFEVSEPVNGVDGRLAGIESVLTWRGRGPFAVLSGRVAATAANSSARFPDRPQKAVVPGQSDWVLKSLVVFDRGPLSFACAVSWSSASLAEVGPEPDEDRYEDERLRVDLSLDWEITPSGWLAHLGLQNGADPEDRFTGPRGQPLRLERSGADLKVSISRRW